MKVKTVTYMTEDEAMQLIKEHFGVDIKSIVAQECLSNQE